MEVKLPELPPIPAALLDVLVKTRNRPTQYLTVIELIRDYARAAVEANRAEAVRSCTCHPSDNPPNPCAKKYALTDCKATQPESGGQGEARCAECGARLEDVRPGKHQHPTCSQHPQPSAAVTAAFDDVLRLLRPTPDVSGGAEQYGFMRGVEAARGAIKKAALAQGGKP